MTETSPNDDPDTASGSDEVEVFVETARPDSGDRWLVYADDTVLFEPDQGARRPALISANTLRTSTTWKRVSAPD
jgi:hypothetical protein